jgi:hypothetical protein
MVPLPSPKFQILVTVAGVLVFVNVTLVLIQAVSGALKPAIRLATFI